MELNIENVEVSIVFLTGYRTERACSVGGEGTQQSLKINITLGTDPSDVKPLFL